jgi:hypothetical protein
MLLDGVMIKGGGDCRPPFVRIFDALRHDGKRTWLFSVVGRTGQLDCSVVHPSIKDLFARSRRLSHRSSRPPLWSRSSASLQAPNTERQTIHHTQQLPGSALAGTQRELHPLLFAQSMVDVPSPYRWLAASVSAPQIRRTRCRAGIVEIHTFHAAQQ